MPSGVGKFWLQEGKNKHYVEQQFLSVIPIFSVKAAIFDMVAFTHLSFTQPIHSGLSAWRFKLVISIDFQRIIQS